MILFVILYWLFHAANTRYIAGLDGGGIGAITVHPSGQLFAVGGKGTNPRVCVYEYPSLKLYRVLRNGTERVYTAMRFSRDGENLATVGGFPDFMLTVKKKVDTAD